MGKHRRHKQDPTDPVNFNNNWDLWITVLFIGACMRVYDWFVGLFS